MTDQAAASQSTGMDEFRAGVTACLRSWSALRTAVEAGWGGVESLTKAEDLRDSLYQVFDGSANPPKSMMQEDLEDNFAIFMEEQFSIVLEDNSERQLADMLFRMYDACYKGDNRLAREMVAVAEKAVAASVAYPVQIQSTEHDEDDDDDDDDMVGAAPTATLDSPTQPLVALPTLPPACEYAAQPVFGAPRKPKPPVDNTPVRQLGESAPVQKVPTDEMDEDGFAAVAPKKGRRKPA